MFNENTFRSVYENACMFSENMSVKYVYSTIPTFSTSSDIHADWVLISVFHGQHGSFTGQKTDRFTLELFFLIPSSEQQKTRDNSTTNYRNWLL